MIAQIRINPARNLIAVEGAVSRLKARRVVQKIQHVFEKLGRRFVRHCRSITLSRLNEQVTRSIPWMIVVVFSGVALWVAVTDVGRPSWATASRQPALVNHAASGVDGPAGFDQAQGASVG